MCHTEYEPIEDVEDLEGYGAGTYYPVRIGDKFCSSRYHVVHKLGHGSSSTTWLARDELLAKYVAIKFVTSEPDGSAESTLLRTLRDEDECSAKTHEGSSSIPELLDEFEVEGPSIQGVRERYHCLVTTAARMTVAAARDASRARVFPPLAARTMAAQLIEVVALLHSRGIVHADLHEANILLRLPDSIHKLSPNELYDKYGEPQLESVIRLDGNPLEDWMPTHGVIPIWFGDDSDTFSLTDARILLTDFSESCQPASGERQASHTPLTLRPPEMFLEPEPYVSFSAEIWSLACTVFAIMGQHPLFDLWFPCRDTMLTEHVDALGQLPGDWWISWTNRSQYLDDNLNSTDGTPRRLLETRLDNAIQKPRRKAGLTEMDDEEKRDFLVLLKSMLSFRPENRPSAQDVIESSWMRRWAKPALRSMEHNARPQNCRL